KQDIWLRQNAREIAEKAARLVHRAYCQKPELLLNEAISTMEDYCDIAAGQADEQIRYVLAGLLMEADRKADGQNIYGQIAKANGKWSREAKLDIAVFNLSEAEDDKEKRWATHGEFKKLIDLERSAKIYCGLLLEREEDKYAQEVLGIVTDKMSENDAEAKLLHAETFRQLGRLVESVEMFYDISTAQIPGWDPMAIGAIADLLASGDENRWEDRGKPSAFLVRCDELAELLAGQTSTEWKVQADLVRAETAVLTGKAEIAEKLLNELNQNGFGEDIGWTRCKARLLSKKGEYTEAAKMWGIVQEARRGKEDGSVRSMRWWRGRFHEIECWSKRTDANGRDIVHAIEVLLYSVENIPEQWSDRFARLKKMAEARN
ncbi:MAG: hypothetical protein KAS23_16705, partial [Anaerohalosphaera sp.]|nr:hypothetical protein [Anaerohalosphaera sp.]